jgi:hypothetical protein
MPLELQAPPRNYPRSSWRRRASCTRSANGSLSLIEQSILAALPEEWLRVATREVPDDLTLSRRRAHRLVEQ